LIAIPVTDNLLLEPVVGTGALWRIYFAFGDGLFN
jgi:hypothetical protein